MCYLPRPQCNWGSHRYSFDKWDEFRHLAVTFSYWGKKGCRNVTPLMSSVFTVLSSVLCNCIINLKTSTADNIMEVQWKTVQTAKSDKTTWQTVCHVEFLLSTAETTDSCASKQTAVYDSTYMYSSWGGCGGWMFKLHMCRREDVPV